MQPTEIVIDKVFTNPSMSIISLNVNDVIWQWKKQDVRMD